MTETTNARAAELMSAQNKAVNLFDQIVARGLIRSGALESQISNEVFELAHQMYGVEKYWHKRIVRSGPNTLLPYAENPPDRVLADDDIAFLDFGPIFETWEADFGRTFVLGQDASKHKLQEDVETAFAQGKEFFHVTPSVTASQLFHHVVELGKQSGWEFGGPMAGHLIGQFPHERIPDDKVSLYIHPNNHAPIRQTGSDGQTRHWILEIHFVDRQKQIGGFFEELLTVG